MQIRFYVATVMVEWKLHNKYDLEGKSDIEQKRWLTLKPVFPGRLCYVSVIGLMVSTTPCIMRPSHLPRQTVNTIKSSPLIWAYRMHWDTLYI